METGSLKRQKVKTRLLGRAVVQQKKRGLGHRQAQRDNHMRTQGEDNHLQAKEGDPKGTNPGSSVLLGFQPPGEWESKFLLLKPPSLHSFVLAAGANQHRQRDQSLHQWEPLLQAAIADRGPLSRGECRRARTGLWPVSGAGGTSYWGLRRNTSLPGETWHRTQVGTKSWGRQVKYRTFCNIWVWDKQGILFYFLPSKYCLELLIF